MRSIQAGAAKSEAHKASQGRGKEKSGPIPRGFRKAEAGDNAPKTGKQPDIGTSATRKSVMPANRKAESSSVRLRSAGKAAKGLDAKSNKSKETAVVGKGGPGGGSGRGMFKPSSGGATPAGKGKKRVRRISLAVEFTVPVCIVILLVIVIWAAVVRARMLDLHVNEIKKAGVSQVRSLAGLGRAILRDKDLYRGREAEGSSWLVEGGHVTAQAYSRMAGEAKAKLLAERPDLSAKPQTLQAEIAQEVEKNASILHFLTCGKDQSLKNEVLAAYVMMSGSKFVAGSHIFKDKVDIDPNQNDWFRGSVDPRVTIAGKDVLVDDVRIVPAMVQVDEKENQWIRAFSFQVDFPGVPSGGTAILALRGDVIEDEKAALEKLMLVVGFVAMVLAACVCVGIAVKVTQPVKTLIKDMEIVSRGNFEHKTRAHSQDEIGQIAVEFNEMTRKLLDAREKEKKAERVESEMEMARDIQDTLLPKGVPAVAGFDIDAVYMPAREVGGDYYDFYPIGTKIHLGIIVADVSGKSVPGAMQMATTRTILRFIADGNTSAANTLARTNAIVAQDIKRGMFVTAFYLVLDARNKVALCASAGHNPLVLVRGNGELQLINPSGIALGFDKGPIFERTIKEQAVQLASGDRVVLYTDGVTEAMNASNEEYSPERFYEWCKKHSSEASSDFIKGLLADLDKHKGRAEQHDDITIVSFRVL